MKKALGLSYPAILVAAAAAFVVGSLWYSPLLFGGEWMRLRGLDPHATAAMPMPSGMLLAEFVREVVAAYVLARFVGLLEVADWKAAVRLGAWAWVGFPGTLLAGSVMWEGVPWQLAAIHAGDWLVKILLMAVILGVWRWRQFDSHNGTIGTNAAG